MVDRLLEARIQATGEEFFRLIENQRPSLFDPGRWSGAVLDWCMQHEAFKVQLFRFVDVFPALHDRQTLMRHLHEYFFASGIPLPPAFRVGAQLAGATGAFGSGLLERGLRSNLREMAQQFILGTTAAETVAGAARLRQEGYAVILDVLGEATLSEAEADSYVATYQTLLNALAQAQGHWSPLGPDRSGATDWGGAPALQLAVKPSAFLPLMRPQAHEEAVTGILQRLWPLAAAVAAAGGELCLDMESWQYRELTLELYRRLRRQLPPTARLSLAIQAYLRCSEADVEALLAWGQGEGLPLGVRLVKGAYWDFETVRAAQNSWEPPVWTHKAETDAAFERIARRLLQAHADCYLACGSHNIRTIAAVLETARSLGVPDERYEFQVLYGMAEPVRRALLQLTGRVRLYAPCGEMVAGMAYLVRRLLENTANESFLRQSFVAGVERAQLLTDPAASVLPPQPVATPGFRNEPVADFSRAPQREAFGSALQSVGRGLGRDYPLLLDGRELVTGQWQVARNPAQPQQVIGRVAQAGPAELEQAVAAARRAFPDWSRTAVAERVALLQRAAEHLRQRLDELAAWQVYEVGKQWDQAHADVTEAIDFLDYYGREALRLATPQRLGNLAGEENLYHYQPRGIAAVIAPWNFPLAISCGMSAAALVTGNCVLFKPSSLSAVTGWLLADAWRAAGIPAGVFQFLPGPGASLGSALAQHPEVDLLAFTGSLDVGLSLVETAARPRPGQRQIKKVVAELGGKNAIIVDDDADLDEAVPHLLASAFAFQGQKCSACSRVIVLDAVYDRFCARLLGAAASLHLGPATEPQYLLGPVVDAVAQQRLLGWIARAEAEGLLLYRSPVPSGSGYYVPLTIAGPVPPEHPLAQEELFGPLLTLLRARDFEQALQWANSTRFALTGGVFSRSPAHLQQARAEFRVGNLYLNRGITGALVGRQPFGGFALSGVGSKAGGPDYLLQFVEPRCITENTLRRGFAPQERAAR